MTTNYIYEHVSIPYIYWFYYYYHLSILYTIENELQWLKLNASILLAIHMSILPLGNCKLFFSFFVTITIKGNIQRRQIELTCMRLIFLHLFEEKKK